MKKFSKIKYIKKGNVYFLIKKIVRRKIGGKDNE